MKMDRGLLAAILAPVFVALSVIFVSLSGGRANPLIISGYSQLLSLVFLLPLYALLKEKLHLRKLVTSLRKPALKAAVARSIGNPIFYAGIALTSTVNSLILLRLEPLFVLLWGLVLLHEKPSAHKFCLALLLLLAAFVVISPSGSVGAINRGDLLVALSLLLFSYSYLPSNAVISKMGPFGLTVLTNIIGGVMSIVAAFILLPSTAFAVPAETALLIVGNTVAFYVIGLTLFFYAFKTVTPWVIASFLSLETVIGFTIAVVFLGATINLVQLLGTAVVLVSTYLIARYR